MKKIKEFFKKQKKRFLTWYSNTLYPVKRVILLVMLCSFVAFSLGSCSTKNPYKQASAAPAADTPVIWVTINYQPQFYYPTSFGNEVKLASDTQLIIRNGNLYYKFFKTEYLLSSTSVNTNVYYYTLNPTDKTYTYSSMPIQVASTFNPDLLSKVSEGSYYITRIDFQNRIDTSHNECWFAFRCAKVGKTDDTTLGSVLMTCNSTVPSGYTLNLNSLPFFHYNIITSDTNSHLYQLGYEQGYNKGLSETLPDIEPWQVIVDGLDSFMNIKLFGSVSLGTVLKVGLSLILVGLIIKVFLGG